MAELQEQCQESDKDEDKPDVKQGLRDGLGFPSDEEAGLALPPGLLVGVRETRCLWWRN